ncbi:hypothetical protein C8T65DRAFT_46348 [Cerioporus squamosus]|nr:hypothetical protein C8T65DRAFT_46348 [Cerioporus squamosus]
MTRFSEQCQASTASGTRDKRLTGRNVGKLALVLNLPMDIFFEIASHLHPTDVLQLARVSRDLRAMLLSRTSRHVWIAARKNVSPPPPDCPEFLSEPRYAYLLFERFCMLCGAGRSINVHYAGLARLCRECWKRDVRKACTLAKDMGIEKDKVLLQVVPTLLPQATRDNLERRAHDVPHDSPTQYSFFFRPIFVDVVEQYRALCRSQAWNQEPMRRFIEDRKRWTLERLNFRSDLIRWQVQLNSQKVDAEEAAEEERIAAITQELRELGWDPTDFPTADEEWDQVMNQPRKLTSRIWTSIHLKLVTCLERERARRVREALWLKYEKRFGQLSQYYLDFLATSRAADLAKRTLPGFWDAIYLPCMHELLVQEPPEVNLLREAFAAIEGTLRTQAEEYRTRVISDLAKVARQGLPAPQTSLASEASGSSHGHQGAVAGPHSSWSFKAFNADLALLDRPSTLFTCGWNTNTTYPYDCLFREYSYLGILEHWQLAHGDMRWKCHAKIWKQGRNVRALLQAVDADEGATTHVGLDRLMHSGYPVCSCAPDAFQEVEHKPRYEVLHVLVSGS